MHNYSSFVNESVSDFHKKWQKIVADHLFENGLQSTILVDTQGYLVVTSKIILKDFQIFTDDKDKFRELMDFVDGLSKVSVETYEIIKPTDFITNVHFTFDFRDGNVPNYFKSIGGLDKYKI